jgi:hypothetical protein
VWYGDALGMTFSFGITESKRMGTALCSGIMLADIHNLTYTICMARVAKHITNWKSVNDFWSTDKFDKSFM